MLREYSVSDARLSRANLLPYNGRRTLQLLRSAFASGADLVAVHVYTQTEDIPAARRVPFLYLPATAYPEDYVWPVSGCAVFVGGETAAPDWLLGLAWVLRRYGARYVALYGPDDLVTEFVD